MFERHPVVYIMTNKRNGTLYTGVTSNIAQRVYPHKQAIAHGFTKQSGCKRLVYYEQYEDRYTAISREKQIKGGSRKKNPVLVECLNPNREGLYETLL